MFLGRIILKFCRHFLKLQCWICFKGNIFARWLWATFLYLQKFSLYVLAGYPRSLSCCTYTFLFGYYFQIGVGIMIFQQFNGINGISFYASETFALAGNSVFLYTSFLMPFLPVFSLEIYCLIQLSKLQENLWQKLEP